MKKKIIIVNSSMKIGGINRALANLLNEIEPLYDITLFLFSKTGEYMKDIPPSVKILSAKSMLKVLALSLAESKKEGLRCYCAKIIYTIISRIFGNFYAIRLACLFEKKLKGYDVAISYMHNSPKKNFYGGTNEFVLYNIEAKEKYAFIHCDYETYGGDIRYAKKIYNRFNKIAFCSTGCARSFLNVIPDFKDKSFVVKNCINFKQIYKDANTDTIIYEKGEFPIISVGRMTYAKGMDKAIELIYRYKQKFNQNIHLYLIGDGSNKKELEHLVDILNMNKYVTFCGNQRNVYKYMKNARLLLLLSTNEAAPMVFDEAKTLGIPILSTNTSSVKEMILDCNAGLVGKDDEEIYNFFVKIVEGNISFNTIQEKDNYIAKEQFKRLINNKKE